MTLRRFGPQAAALACAAAALMGGFGDGGCCYLGTAQKRATCREVSSLVYPNGTMLKSS